MKCMPQDTKLNNDQAAVENNWQITLENELKQGDFGVPSKETTKKIKQKIQQMEQVCDEWCYTHKYKPILDIDVKKVKFQEEEAKEI